VLFLFESLPTVEPWFKCRYCVFNKLAIDSTMRPSRLQLTAPLTAPLTTALATALTTCMKFFHGAANQH
jgi:hypothetical protein